MGSQLSRRHHYNPKMLLKNFCDDDGRLWMGERTGGRIFSSTPQDAFVKRDLNRSYDFPPAPISGKEEEFLNSIKASDKYEQMLSRLEGEAAPVVQKVIEQARHKQFPQLSPEDSNTLKRFILATERRTPESQKRIAAGKSFEDAFWEAVVASAENGPAPGLPERAAFYRAPLIAKLKDKVQATVNAGFAAGDRPRERDKEEQVCRETGLYVAVIHTPGRGFVIGSHGLAIVQSPYGNDPAEGPWLPIAHDVAVGLTFSPGRELLILLDRSRDRIIKSINSASVAKSQRIAGRSKDLVRALIKERQRKN